MAHDDPAFASLAHDLSQLLWAIQGRARALASRLDPESATIAAFIARDAAAAVAMLTDSDDGATDPLPIVRDAWLQAIDQAEARGRTGDAPEFLLSVPALPPPVAMPAAALRRILGNLFANAIEAASGRVKIVCEFEQAADQVRLRVQDDGPGVPAELRARLFEPGATAGKPGGRGLGLAGARALARRWGGDLIHDHRAAGGAFVLTLPIAETIAAAPDAPVQTAPAGLRILAVDDEPAVREMLQDLLQSEGHRPTVTADHDSALAVFRPGRYDAALIDLSLPGKTGPALAAALRRADPALAVMVVTGWGRERELASLDAADVDLTGTKPLDLPQLRSLLARAAALTAQRRGQRTPED